jgi:hypothetical protein
VRLVNDYPPTAVYPLWILQAAAQDPPRPDYGQRGEVAGAVGQEISPADTSHNKQPSANTMYAIVTRNEGCASMYGMGVRMPIHAMAKRISEMIKTNDLGACRDI